MCTCKKNSRLDKLLKYLQGYFETVGGSLNNKDRVSLYDIYGYLLSSLYQLDDDGNKVFVDYNPDSNEFEIDVNRPLYVGSLRDNSDSKYVESRGYKYRNFYDEIVNFGFKPYDPENIDIDVALNSFVIDAEEDTEIPIEWINSVNNCNFQNKIRALCLTRVNFNIYEEYTGDGNLLIQYSGNYGIKRIDATSIGFKKGFTEPISATLLGFIDGSGVSEETGAVDRYGNIIHKHSVSVLMLPLMNESYYSDFVLYGHSDDNYESPYDYIIDRYKFDIPVNYGETVNARGQYEVVKVNFVNVDSKYSDLVPTDSCQFIGTLRNSTGSGSSPLYFGTRLDGSFNNIYCDRTKGIEVMCVPRKNYIDENINYYIKGAFFNGLYYTKFINSNKIMYLYNTNGNRNLSTKGDTIDLKVGRLPVINLTGKISKDDFDSSKPYIYILREGYNTSSGLLLFTYDNFDSDLILQVSDPLVNFTGNCYKLTSRTTFTIYCSSTAPNESYLCNKDDGNATDVYSLVCEPTLYNKEVQYTLTKL